MSKFSLKAVLAVLELLLSIIAKAISLIDVIRDLLDDGEVNSSSHYLSSDLKAFKEDLLDWSGQFNESIEDERKYTSD